MNSWQFHFLNALLLSYSFLYVGATLPISNRSFLTLKYTQTSIPPIFFILPIEKQFITLLIFSLGSSTLFFSFLQLISHPALAIQLLIWSSCSIILSTTDVLYYLLPNRILGFFYIISFGHHLYFSPSTLFFYCYSGCALFALFYLFFFLSPNGLGGGDVKLAGLIGFFFGYTIAIQSLFIACLIALIFAMIKMKTCSEEKPLIPFGPFLFIGSWIVWIIK